MANGVCLPSSVLPGIHWAPSGRGLVVEPVPEVLAM